MFDTTVFTVIVVSFAVLPTLGYILWGRPYRRRPILGYFTKRSIADYFDQFLGGSDFPGRLTTSYRAAVKADPNSEQTARAERDLCDAMFDLYNRRLGWFAYVAPLIVLAAVLYVESAAISHFAKYWLETFSVKAFDATGIVKDILTKDPELPDTVVVAAIAGGYLWVGLFLIGRMTSATLLPSDINYCSLRMIIAPAIGYSLSTLAGDAKATSLVAFVVSFLPFADILSWSRTLAAKSLGVTDAPEDSADRIMNLPGVDSNVAARLYDQGVTTIRQLADTDPVQISMRSGLDFAFVISLVDEALAWTYFGKTLPALRAFGWTGVSDIISDAVSPETLEDAAVAYINAVKALKKTNAAVSSVQRQLAPATASSPSGPAAASLSADAVDARQAAAQKAEIDARLALRDTVLALPDGELLSAIASNAELKLTVAGVRNITAQITADSYNRFIRGLIRDLSYESTALAAVPGQKRVLGGLRERYR